MLHHVEIAFLFISFQFFRLEHEQILLDLDLPQIINLWLKFHSRKAALKASGTSFLGRKVAKLATKLIQVFVLWAKF